MEEWKRGEKRALALMNDASLQENGTEQTAGDETLEAPRRRRWWWEAALVVGFWTVLAVLMASNDLLNAGEGAASGDNARDAHSANVQPETCQPGTIQNA